jgi:hypothetical protein
VGRRSLGFGVHGFRRVGALRPTRLTAKARTVRHGVGRVDEGATFHHTVAARTARDGRRRAYSSRGGRGTAGNDFCVGAHVVVRHDSKAPDLFAIEGWDTRRGDPLFTMLGSMLVVGAVTILHLRLITH